MKHAKLPASAAHRWTACPASAYMDEQGDRRGSSYAAEGTAAHHLVETCLTNEQDPRFYLGTTLYVDEEGDVSEVLAPLEDAEKVFGPTPDDEWAFEVGPEMVEAAELFIQVTKDALITEGLDGVAYIEERVSPGHESLGGTLDWAYVDGANAVIADLKYGRGVIVEVEENPQQMIYALGLMERHPEIKRILSYIVQPRAPHADGPVRWTEYTAEQLAKFYQWLLECIDAADAPGAPRIAGDHCRFCPDLANCPEALATAQAAAAVEFGADDPGDQIAEALALAPMVEAWCKAIRKEALSRLMDEQEVPGWKLVHGRGSREWNAEQKAVLALARKAGLLKSDCMSAPKLLSPYGLEQAAARKRMTGKGAKTHFAELVENIPGGPTVAPEDDPRELYRSAPEDDFAV